MKTVWRILFLISALILSFSCNSGKKDISRLEQQRDSLEVENQTKEDQLSELQSYLDTLSSSLDSIVMQEHLLFLPDPENPDKTLTKKQIQERLNAFQELVNRQHLRIKELEEALMADSVNLASMRNLVSYYRTQIQVKNAEIDKMRQELKVKNTSIKKLNAKVSEMTSDIDGLNSDIDYLLGVSDQQQQIMTAQDEILNEAYYLIGTKKELAALGIRTNNLASGEINLSNFTKVDKRKCDSIKLPSAKVKILTQMPTGTYSIVKNTDGTSVLEIMSAADFWQFSNILIIQTK